MRKVAAILVLALIVLGSTVLIWRAGADEEGLSKAEHETLERQWGIEQSQQKKPWDETPERALSPREEGQKAARFIVGLFDSMAEIEVIRNAEKAEDCATASK